MGDYRAMGLLYSILVGRVFFPFSRIMTLKCYISPVVTKFDNVSVFLFLVFLHTKRPHQKYAKNQK